MGTGVAETLERAIRKLTKDEHAEIKVYIGANDNRILSQEFLANTQSPKIFCTSW